MSKFIEFLELEELHQSFEDRKSNKSNKSFYVWNCPICKTEGIDILKGIRRCPDCGTQYKMGDTVEESIPDIDYVRDLNIMQAEIINRHLKKNSNILEIGCAYGDMLQFFKDRSHKVHGVDMVDFKRKEYDFDVFKVKLENVTFDRESFDAIVMIHVIEHLSDPVRCMKKIRSWLKPNGKVFIFTNEADNFPTGCIIDLLQQDTHKQLITEKGFRVLADKSDYKVAEFVHRWDYQIFTILEKRG